MNDSVNTRLLKSATQGIEYTRGLVGLTTASCLSSSCTYWNVCFILSSTSLSCPPADSADESAGSSPSRPVFSGRQEGPWPSPCFEPHIHLSIHHFASGRSRGLGATLREPVGDCDKSRNREALCALAWVDAELGEI